MLVPNFFMTARKLLYVAIFAALFFALPTNAQQSIQINDYAGLCKIGVDAAYPLDGNYELTADIDAVASKTANGGAGFAPIGSASEPFIGKFDGKGFVISGLYINRPDVRNVGLFGFVEGGAISRLTVATDTVIGLSNVGALVGRAENTVIDSCAASGVIRNTGSFVGGLVGYADSCTMTLCNFSGTVIGGASNDAGNLGGLVGYAANGQIIECGSAGIVLVASSSVMGIGGLIGNNAGVVSKSSSAVSVRPSNDYITLTLAGGLIGYNTGDVTECRSTGSVSEDVSLQTVGGLIGRNSGTVTNSNSSATVGNGSGYTRDQIGGLIGENAGAVTNCYYGGVRRGVRGRYDVGGLIGANRGGTVTNSRVSNISVFGDSIVGGLIGGNYQGVIEKCYYETVIDETSFVIGGVVHQIITPSDSVNSTQGIVGGLIGFNQGAVTQSYSVSSVKGDSFVGGLIGWHSDSSVTKSFSKGLVVGSGVEVGGLIGRLDGWRGEAAQSYSTSSVEGTTYVGGLMGRVVSSKVVECYSTGRVKGNVSNTVGGLIGESDNLNNITRSYWATDISDQQESRGGIPSDTIFMKDGRTFDSWDFENVWKIDIGKSYPYFIYETEVVSIAFRNNRTSSGSSSSAFAPRITIKGKTLNVSSTSTNTVYQIRVLDVRGRVAARFTVNGNASFSLGRMPAGRYLVEVRANGKLINVSSHTIQRIGR